MTGNMLTEHWSSKVKSIEFQDLYGTVNALIDQFSHKPLASSVIYEYPYNYALELRLGSKVLATVGKINPKALKLAGVKQDLFFADVDWYLLLKQTNEDIEYKEVPKFPEVRRDLSLVMDKSVSFAQVKALALEKERRLLRAINVFDVYEGDKIDANKKAYALSFILQDAEKTLTDKVIDKTMDKLMNSFENNLGAVIRK